MIWGKPMWGAWWVWDARLTSVAILGFLYVGYLILLASAKSIEQGLKPGAMLLVIGCLNLPIIKFSVEWWNTLHQGASVFRMDGPSIHPDMLRVLLIMALGMGALAAGLGLVRIKTALSHIKLEGMRFRARLKGDVTCTPAMS